MKQFLLSDIVNSKENDVNIYVCGPTVYNSVHIGNLRPILFFSILKNILNKYNKNVNLVQNITDIDDKIIAVSEEKNIEWKDVSRQYSKEYINLLNSINVNDINFVYATNYINEYISLSTKLLDSGKAYRKDSGIYLSVNSIKNYGSITNKNISELNSQNEDVDKNNNNDFAIMKTDNKYGWSTMYGNLRPGWHTECFVMIDSIFKGNLDIHGGGSDLGFPHHENENALSISKNNKELSKWWIHVGMITINGDKMSKSKNNFILAKDFINENGPNIINLLFISSSYSKPININDELIMNLKKMNVQIQKSIYHLYTYMNICSQVDIQIDEQKELTKYISSLSLTNIITLIQKILKKINSGIISKKNYKVYYDFINETLSLLDLQYEYTVNDKIINVIRILESETDRLKQDKIINNSDLSIRKTRIGWEVY